MPKGLRVIAALLFVTAPLLIPTAMAGEALAPPGTAPQIIAFDTEDFLGDHLHICGTMKELGKWGNRISSRVILSGTWEQPYSENKELCARDRFEAHMISESLNPPGEPIDKMAALTFIEVMGSQLPIRFVAGEHVEGTDHHRVGHRHEGPLLAAPGSQPLL